MHADIDVWITGIGAHTAAGAGASSLATALARGESRAVPHAEFGNLWVAAAPDPEIGKIGKRLDRSGALFVAAAREAWQHAALDRVAIDPDRVGVLDGSSLGPMTDVLASARRAFDAESPAAARPSDVARMLFGSGGAAFAQEIGAHGPVFALSAGSTSGSIAMIEACHKIRFGLADVIVAGGADSPLDPLIVESFVAARILAPGGDALPCRPFDIARRGTMLGEGAGVVILESAEHARRRGVAPLAVIRGTGASGEDQSFIAPDRDGAGTSRAARAALGTIAKSRLGWIKAHGTGTRSNDASECLGLGDLASSAPVTSLKPLIGHCLGASGAIELVAAVLAMHRGLVPATLGTTVIDPALREYRIAIEPEDFSGDTALLLSQSLGGRTTAIALGIAA